MKQKQILPDVTLNALIDSAFKKRIMVRFKAQGSSMSPFIKSGDIVLISPYFHNDTIKIGDIVVANPYGEKILVHRVIKKRKNKNFLLKGDNCIDPDGEFNIEKILGYVKNIERKGKKLRYNRVFTFLIAVLSDSGLLNKHILPFLRYLKNRICLKNTLP